MTCCIAILACASLAIWQWHGMTATPNAELLGLSQAQADISLDQRSDADDLVSKSAAAALPRRSKSPTLELTQPQPLLPVPCVIGKREGAGKAILQHTGLKQLLKGSAWDDAIPAGYIVSQEPTAGSAVAPGSEVGVMVSQGKCAKVPNLLGKSKDQAAAALEQAGLKFRGVLRNTSAAQGTVIAMDPAPEATVAVGTMVTVTVSRGEHKMVSTFRQVSEPSKSSRSNGTLEISAAPKDCTIWLYVDGGQPRGKCPTSIELNRGLHSVILWDPTHQKDLRFNINIKRGQTITLHKVIH